MQDFDPWKVWVVSGALAAGILGSTAVRVKSIPEFYNQVIAVAQLRTPSPIGSLVGTADSASAGYSEYSATRSFHSYASRVFSPIPVAVVASFGLAQSQSETVSEINPEISEDGIEPEGENVTGPIIGFENALIWNSTGAIGDSNQAMVAYDLPVLTSGDETYANIASVSDLNLTTVTGNINGQVVIDLDGADASLATLTLQLRSDVVDDLNGGSIPDIGLKDGYPEQLTQEDALSGRNLGNVDQLIAENSFPSGVPYNGPASPQQIYQQQIAAYSALASQTNGGGGNKQQQAAAQQAAAFALLANQRGGNAAQQYLGYQQNLAAQQYQAVQQYQQNQAQQGYLNTGMPTNYDVSNYIPPSPELPDEGIKPGNGQVIDLGRINRRGYNPNLW